MEQESTYSRTGAEAGAGIAAILPAVIAMVPFALILGQQAAARGLTPVEVLAMSTIVFAGSAQYLAVSLWTDPLPIAALALSTLLINLRHILMGASIAPRIRWFGGWRYPAALILTDELWAVAERRALIRPVTPAFWFGGGLFLFLCWQCATVLGAIVGSFLRDPARYGVDFAFPAFFLALALGFWRGWRTAPVIGTAALVSIVVHALVPGAWYVIVGALAGIAAAVVVGPAEQAGERAP